MSYQTINIPLGTFSSVYDEELESRLEIGAVHFRYMMVTDTDTHSPGEIREAYGTRNLSMSIIDPSKIPSGAKNPPSHVLTYFDIDRMAWRCCDRGFIIEIDPNIIVEL